MKKLFLAILLVLFISVPAMAASGVYLSVKGSSSRSELEGVNFKTIPNGLLSTHNQDASERYTGYGAAVGVKYAKHLRTEIEYMKRGDIDYASDGFDVLPDYISPTITIPSGWVNAHANVQTETAFLNTYLDTPTWKGFGCYVGAGIGIAFHKAKTNINILENGLGGGPYSILTEKDSNNALAYNASVGVFYDILNSGLTVDVAGRYADLGKVDMGTLFDGDSMKVKEVVVSVRYAF